MERQFTDQDLVYYGPHPCRKCDPDGELGTLIVKAGNGAPDDLEFDFTHGSYYPNHVWTKHLCSDKNRTAQKLGSISTPAKVKSSRENGKKGGRPKVLKPTER